MSTEHEATQMLQRPDEAVLRAAAERRSARAISAPASIRRATRPTARILPGGVHAAPLKASVFDPVSAAQVKLGNALLDVWPRARFDEHGAPITSVRDVLEELTGLTGFRFDLHGLRVLSTQQKWPELGHAAQWRFELPTSPDYGIVSVDQSLLDPVLGAMLSESTGGVRRAGGLSMRDHGLFSFVMLRLVDALVTRHEMPPFVLAVEPPSREEVIGLGRRSSSGVVEVAFLVSTATSAGFVRFFMTAPMVRKLEVWREARPLATHHSEELGALAKSVVSTPITLASMTLGQVDMWELAAGDVLLPPAHGLSEECTERLGVQAMTRHTGRLYLGAAQSIGVMLDVDHELGMWRAQVTEVQVRQDNSTDARSGQEQANMSEEAAQEHTSDLLREVNVELEVRLAGVVMRVDELASMQVGQIIGLGVPIGEPVELVAGGKRLGRGELVNVEGNLGVRVLSRE